MPTHDERLALRLARPQRHRLLQGYPPLPAMQSATPRHDAQRLLDGSLRGPDGTLLEPPVIQPDPQRPLLVGVLPHGMCNPRVRGCGFCTFPHERYHRKVCESVTARVLESSLALLRHQRLEGRKVAALYFGGGTATLTPMAGLAQFASALAERLELADAEITVEGVPAHLRSWLRSPLAHLARLPGRHRRVSMGVQTFDGAWLKRMGREAFGDVGTVRAVVADAHARGITASADLLFNLPGQTLPQMLEDVRRAVDCGLDQLCLYHLVLHPDLGTPWSRDPTLLAALPGQEEAFAALEAARLLTLDEAQIRLTPRGMFFADSVVGLLAEDRVESLRPAAAGVHTRDLNAIPLSMG